MSKTSKLDRETIVGTWAYWSLKDFYVAFDIENKFSVYSTFFCHQGLEKMCKAYLIGTKASRYESLSIQVARKEVNDIAKNECGHDLREMIKNLISYNVLHENIFKNKYAKYGNKDVTGKSIIKILEKAYLECRYPVPNPIHKNYPVKTKGLIIIYDSPLSSTKLRKFAYEVGLKIIEKIEKDFNMIIPREKFSTKINDEDWIRFRRIFFNDI